MYKGISINIVSANTEDAWQLERSVHMPHFFHWRYQQKHIHTYSYAHIHSTLTCPRINTIHLFALTIVHAFLLTLASTSSGMPLILKHTLTHHTHLHLPTHVLIFATLITSQTHFHTHLFIHSCSHVHPTQAPPTAAFIQSCPLLTDGHVIEQV